MLGWKGLLEIQDQFILKLHNSYVHHPVFGLSHLLESFSRSKYRLILGVFVGYYFLVLRKLIKSKGEGTECIMFPSLPSICLSGKVSI